MITKGTARAARRRGGRRPRSWAVLALGLGVVVLAVLLFRDPIGRWLYPDAAIAGQLALADDALRLGELSAAAERYRAAQARSPDHPRVLQGLAAVRSAALQRAAEAAGRGDAAEARRLLELAAGLGAAGDRLAAVERLVAARAEPGIEAMLARALAIEAIEPDTALAVYGHVLGREPGNRLALAGRARLLSARLEAAGRALDVGDVATAATLVREVRAIDPAHLALPALEARLGPHAAREPERAGAGETPPAEHWAEAARWRGLAEEALGRGALDEARLALDRAAQLDPGASELVPLERRWQAAATAVPPSG